MAVVKRSETQFLFFGGQNDKNDCYDEYYQLTLCEAPLAKLEKFTQPHPEETPKKRTTHTITPTGDGKAYLYGGANDDGPRMDLYEIDLNKPDDAFTKIYYECDKALEHIRMARLEMHTAHWYEGALYFVGGRWLYDKEPLT